MTGTFKQLNYNIRLLAPVLIGNSVGDENISLSQNYLSGTALLGMFAQIFLKKNGLTHAHSDEGFYKFFLSGALQFLNGYKAVRGIDGILRSLPTPLSIEYDKETESDPYEILFEDSADSNNAAKPETKHKEGFCALEANHFIKVKVEKLVNFHHQRTNQLVGRSEESEIFNYEYLKPGQEFIAGIVGPEEMIVNFLASLESKKFIGRLGRSRNTEYGAVEVDFTSTKLADVDERHLKNPISLNEDEASFNLTMLSHTILPDENGIPVVNAAVVKKYLLNHFDKNGLGLNEEQVEMANVFSRSVDIENYVAVWQARKPSVYAFQMGSCFRVKVPDSLSDQQVRILLSSLKTLQETGMGARRNEGFGRVAIQWQTGKELVTAEEQKNVGMPATPPPLIVKHILKSAIQDHFIGQIKANACSQVSNFERLPGGSLFGRLLGFVNSADSRISFIDKVKGLKDTAQVNLKQCIRSDHSENLYDFLTENIFFAPNGQIDSLLAVASGAEKMEMTREQIEICRLLEYNPADDKELKANLFEIYFTTFLALMRKKATKEAAHGR